MVQQAMSSRWSAVEAQMFWFASFFFFLVSRIHGCSSLNSEGYPLLQFGAKVNFDPSGALANWNPNDCDPSTLVNVAVWMVKCNARCQWTRLGGSTGARRGIYLI